MESGRRRVWIGGHISQLLLATRILVGIGEGGYGPAAPTLLADLFPLKTRGRALAVFCAAVPVGNALGYVLGGLVTEYWDWRWAFYVLTPPGCFSEFSASFKETRALRKHIPLCNGDGRARRITRRLSEPLPM